MKSIVIFDPALCCSSGVCGPSVDPKLVRMSNVVIVLKKKGFDVQRYNLSKDTDAYVNNSIINSLMQEKGTNSLPSVLIDGQLVKSGDYPSGLEWAEWTGIPVEELEFKNVSQNQTIKLEF